MENFYSHAFASDNFSGVHPKIMAAIQKANKGHTMAYGSDPWTVKFEKACKKAFGNAAEGFVVFNGTAANICGLQQLMQSWQAVICPESAHIATDECGAAQANVGCHLLTARAIDGKLCAEGLESFLGHKGFQHHSQPAAISISQTTELGTVYSIEEMKKIGKFAHANEMLFVVDGARLSNAAASLNVSLKAITTDVGADMVTFGGTKNGAMGAESVIFLKKGLSDNFPYVRKQRLQLASKMRFLSAQMATLLEDNLWEKNARHSNAMAKKLEAKIREEFPQFRILYPVQANALFVQLPKQVIAKLQKKNFFWVWDEEKGVARWMASWDTKEEHINEFVKEIRGLL